MGLFDMFTQDIAIDLGTANTLIIHNNKIVVDQPSIVAIERSSGKPIAVGEKAKHMNQWLRQSVLESMYKNQKEI